MTTLTHQPAQTKLPVGTWRVDPVHSTIGFSAPWSDGVTIVDGRFTDFEGTLELTEDGGRAYGTIKTASITTQNEQRDAHLRSPDFFGVENAPEITFASTRVEPTDGGILVAGKLKIRELVFEVELPLAFRGPANDAYGNERIAVDGTSTIEWADDSITLVVKLSAVRA
jgi:polyisoprenoid-binding protein YceI